MKCICRVKCFCEDPATRRNRVYSPGMVEDFEECPTHFDKLNTTDESVVDFLNAGEAELMALKWKAADAKIAIKAAFDVVLTGKKKETLVAQILDARQRAIGKEELPPAAK